MKLIRIGSAPSCDIIFSSDFVSALHAELTLLDNGEILISDRNSKNGTFIGKTRLQPMQETPVRRGTPVLLADMPLPWERIPRAENLAGYNHIYNIGSSGRNDIVLDNQAVSRYHASLRVRGGKAFIHDNGSRNGTEVNGRKIVPNTDVQIRRRDNVVCADEDITTQIATFIPVPFIRRIAVALASCVLLALIGWGVWRIIGSTPVQPEDFRNSVVYLRAGYHYEVSLDDDPVGLNITMRYPKDQDAYVFEQATAFFIDNEGRMGTNRHVAVPWAYRDKDEEEKMRQAFEEYLAKELRVDIVHLDNYDDLKRAWRRLTSTKLGTLLLAGCESVDELNARLSRYRRAKIKIEGVMDFITVGYPGRHYTHTDEFQRCYVLAESGDTEKDVAILQLNDKQTPSLVSRFLSIGEAYTKNLVPMADELYTIGYPNGISWALDNQTKSLEPNIRETKCSKEPSKYSFEFQASSVEGSSGSPVFNKYGQLVGILAGGYKNASTSAVKARYLQELYNDVK